jgi:hypothetical protein
MNFLDFPQHVSASNCHHQGGRSALEATQARSVLWMYMDYDSSSVVSCREMQPAGCRNMLGKIQKCINKILLLSRRIYWSFYYETLHLLTAG